MSTPKMESPTFPLDHYLRSVVQLLDAVKYEDHIYERSHRIKLLEHTYTATADHFAQKLNQVKLQMSLQKLDAILATCVNLTVCCYPKLSQDLLTSLAIFFVYFVVIDDNRDKPDTEMESFFVDLVQGKEQTNWWLREINEHLTASVLKHYGSFCAFTIVRGTLDCKAIWRSS